VNDAVAAAYSATAGAWAQGPERIYARLAEAMLACSPTSLVGRSVLDVGAGTGAAGAAAQAVGAASVVAVDAALGMLRHNLAGRPPAVAADALALPFAAATFDAAIAAFSLNHVGRPADGLREMLRVVRPGGPVLAAAYAADDTHPVKHAVEGALIAAGWKPPSWYEELRRDVVPLLATIDGCRAAADGAGLDADVHAIRVPFPGIGPGALVAWRLGMAQSAPFADALPPAERDALTADALGRLGPTPSSLERSMLVIAGVVRA
jgi:ubiquinone/menaquinone biosynthesis C-methylase UbiE